MTLHEVEIAGQFAFHPGRLIYLPDRGVLQLWIDEEYRRGELCAVLEPTSDQLPSWAQDGWMHIGECSCGWCLGEWE